MKVFDKNGNELKIGDKVKLTRSREFFCTVEERNGKICFAQDNSAVSFTANEKSCKKAEKI